MIDELIDLFCSWHSKLLKMKALYCFLTEDTCSIFKKVFQGKSFGVHMKQSAWTKLQEGRDFFLQVFVFFCAGHTRSKLALNGCKDCDF